MPNSNLTMGQQITPIIAAKTRPLLKAITDNAEAWGEAGHPEEEVGHHAFASLAVAIRMLTRGVFHDIPQLQSRDDEWLILALRSGILQAQEGKDFEHGL